MIEEMDTITRTNNINYQKIHLICRAIFPLTLNRKNLYQFKEDDKVQQFLWHKKFFNEKELLLESADIIEREKKSAKRSRKSNSPPRSSIIQKRDSSPHDRESPPPKKNKSGSLKKSKKIKKKSSLTSSNLPPEFLDLVEDTSVYNSFEEYVKTQNVYEYLKIYTEIEKLEKGEWDDESLKVICERILIKDIGIDLDQPIIVLNDAYVLQELKEKREKPFKTMFSKVKAEMFYQLESLYANFRSLF